MATQKKKHIIHQEITQQCGDFSRKQSQPRSGNVDKKTHDLRKTTVHQEILLTMLRFLQKITRTQKNKSRENHKNTEKLGEKYLTG